MVPHELHRPCQRISESENVNVRSAEMHCLHTPGLTSLSSLLKAVQAECPISWGTSRSRSAPVRWRVGWPKKVPDRRDPGSGGLLAERHSLRPPPRSAKTCTLAAQCLTLNSQCRLDVESARQRKTKRKKPTGDQKKKTNQG